MSEEVKEEVKEVPAEEVKEGEQLEEQKEEVAPAIENQESDQNKILEASKEPEDLFAGELEPFIEKPIIGDPNFEDKWFDPNVDKFDSEIKPKRKEKELYKVFISRAKENFEEPVTTLFSIKSASEEPTAGNNEVKGTKNPNEYPLEERPYIEMGFQTPNASVTKTYQVSKKEYKNQYTQVEPKFADIREEIQKFRDTLIKKNLNEIEIFLNKAKISVEQALQSNETINIFMNDFDLEKNQRILSEEKKPQTNQQQEIRTYRDNSAGNKNKKEKCVKIIRAVSETDPFIAITLLRNFTFDQYKEKFGIPYESKIIFWNIRDIEQNSPIFEVETRSEVTCFEFDPSNCNNFACALISGQIMFVKFTHILDTLREHANTDYSSISNKINTKEHYIYNISGLKESHKGRVNGLRWLTKGYCFGRKQPIIYQQELKESGILASLGEDGQIILWDYKSLDIGSPKCAVNEVVNFIKHISIEINKVDSIGRISGTGLEYDLIDNKFLFYAANEEGRTYYVDMSIKVTQDNLAANVTKYYYNRYFRPVLFFQKSPFFEDIFLTVHDFHFCLWCKERSKPILISPNLKKSSYTCGKFSPSRPGVIYLCRSNGKIDIWDFLDESHKPSVKDSFIKETITSLEIFRYNPPEDENEEGKTAVSCEYMLVGDISGQMNVIEIPKLFCEPAQEEQKMMREFFDNEIKRQNYMDGRAKALEDRINANNSAIKKDQSSDQFEFELKTDEDNFLAIRNSILEKLGLGVISAKPEDKKEEA